MNIAALMPTHSHVRTAKHHSRLNISKYFGLQIVINEIQKNLNCTIPIIDYKSAHLYDVILVSVHSVPDFYSLAYTYYNRMKGKRSGTWILGGAAIANIPPLLPFADYIVLGRAENLIIPLLKSIKVNLPFDHESVVHVPTWSRKSTFKVAYVQKLYPDTIGKAKETMLGCKYNCSYCRYRVSSIPPNMREQDRETTMPGNEETFWELEIKNGSFYTTSLDGLTVATRHAVVKHISNEAILKKFTDLIETRHHLNLKIYLICGYPGQPDLDFTELKAIFQLLALNLTTQKWNIKLHITPFSPEPQTPMQWEAANVDVNFRELAPTKLINGTHLVKTENLSVLLLPTIASPYTLLQRLIFNRSSMEHTALIKTISSTPYFRSHNNSHADKFNKICELYDITTFVREYPIGSTLPSSQVQVWRNQESIERQGAKTRKKLEEIAQTLVY